MTKELAIDEAKHGVRDLRENYIIYARYKKKLLLKFKILIKDFYSD
jgi:hypothetical protein